MQIIGREIEPNIERVRGIGNGKDVNDSFGSIVHGKKLLKENNSAFILWVLIKLKFFLFKCEKFYDEIVFINWVEKVAKQKERI